jgi:hypothetical protein
MVTIIIGSSYDLIIEVQERVWYKLLPQSHSIGGELLPLHHVATGDGVDGVEGATGSGSSSVSPPILIVQGFVLCICVSLPPHYEITRGGVYIVDLGPDELVEPKFAAVGPTRCHIGPTMRPGSWPTWWELFWPSWCSISVSSSHDLLFLEKMTWWKEWVRLTSSRSLQVKNKEIRVMVLKPNEWGLFRNSMKSMENMHKSL